MLRARVLARLAAALQPASDQLARGQMRGLTQALVYTCFGDVSAVRAGPAAFDLERLHARIGGQATLASGYHLAGDARIAALLYDRLLPERDRFTAYMLYEGSVSHALGLLAQTLGRPRAAADHFEHALTQNRKIGAEPWRAQVAVAYAELLAKLVLELQTGPSTAAGSVGAYSGQ